MLCADCSKLNQWSANGKHFLQIWLMGWWGVQILINFCFLGWSFIPNTENRVKKKRKKGQSYRKVILTNQSKLDHHLTSFFDELMSLILCFFRCLSKLHTQAAGIKSFKMSEGAWRGQHVVFLAFKNYMKEKGNEFIISTRMPAR